ncbi:hypothetical protein TYRP_016287 [Tyrophagus putrescentiae]|nr:hypothetical protein TYRP_016287 [Tyrophagus putrescentiae]
MCPTDGTLPPGTNKGSQMCVKQNVANKPIGSGYTLAKAMGAQPTRGPALPVFLLSAALPSFPVPRSSTPP